MHRIPIAFALLVCANACSSFPAGVAGKSSGDPATGATWVLPFTSSTRCTSALPSGGCTTIYSSASVDPTTGLQSSGTAQLDAGGILFEYFDGTDGIGLDPGYTKDYAARPVLSAIYKGAVDFDAIKDAPDSGYKNVQTDPTPLKKGEVAICMLVAGGKTTYGKLRIEDYTASRSASGSTRDAGSVTVHAVWKADGSRSFK